MNYIKAKFLQLRANVLCSFLLVCHFMLLLLSIIQSFNALISHPFQYYWLCYKQHFDSSQYFIWFLFSLENKPTDYGQYYGMKRKRNEAKWDSAQQKLTRHGFYNNLLLITFPWYYYYCYCYYYDVCARVFVCLFQK